MGKTSPSSTSSIFKALRQLRKDLTAPWPEFEPLRYVFHFTELQNAVSVLTDNQLLSRKAVETSGKTIRQSASEEILRQTHPNVLDYVRFYWRPRVPMLYRTEGIRIPDERHYKYWPARCEVPIYFVIPSAYVLSQKGVWFTDRNASSAACRFGHGLEFLKTIPFVEVFHEGPVPPASDIISRRQAEILVPKRLVLPQKTIIYCRSNAERETLLRLLPPETAERWRNQIVAQAPYPTFFKRWLFVQDVQRRADLLLIQWNPDVKALETGKVSFTVDVRTDWPTRQHFYDCQPWTGSRSSLFRLPGAETAKWTVTVNVEGTLAFFSELSP